MMSDDSDKWTSSYRCLINKGVLKYAYTYVINYLGYPFSLSHMGAMSQVQYHKDLAVPNLWPHKALAPISPGHS
jgi:hypothetical protein